jgi:hypothetical protein
LYLSEDDESTSINDSQLNAGGAEDAIATPQKGTSWSAAQSGHRHTRADSEDSEDPLAWNPRTYQQRTRSVAGLVDDLSNTDIGEPGSAGTSVVKGNDGNGLRGMDD